MPAQLGHADIQSIPLWKHRLWREQCEKASGQPASSSKAPTRARETGASLASWVLGLTSRAIGAEFVRLQTRGKRPIATCRPGRRAR